MELTDVAKVAANEAAEKVNKDIDRKIAHWKMKLEQIPKIIEELEASRKPLIEKKVNDRLRRISKAGITIEVPPAELGIESH